MSDDLYHPPTCPIYVDRLIADTLDLSNEEFGAYMRLMLARQWPKGSIPADAADQARIAGNISPARMKKIAAAIGSRFKPHPSVPGAVHSPFMERVRSEMCARNKKNIENGKKGAEARWGGYSQASGEATGDAVATGWRTDRFQSPDPISRDQLATLADSAREATLATAATMSPPFVFCRWMLDEGIKRGVISAHFAGDPFAWCYQQLEAAETLVGTYGEDECRARAERFFAASESRKIRRMVNVISLLRVWDFVELRPPVTPVADVEWA